MAKVRMNKYGVPETNNHFRIRGIVFGTKFQNYYKDEGKMRTISFGVNINANKPIYCRLQGFTRDAVYYSNNDRNNPQTVKVNWANRLKAPKEGYEIIGFRAGLERDAEGKNITKTMTEYDATLYLSNQLEDGDSVTIIGKVDPYIGNDGTVKKNYVIEQIYREYKDIDFNAENFEESATFTQTLVFTDIEKETDFDGKATGRFVVSGHNVSYQNICPMKFIINKEDAAFAKDVRNDVKAFNAIDIAGYIDVVTNVSEESETSVKKYGSYAKYAGKQTKKVNGPTVTEFIMCGMDDFIDDEKYDEKSIATALRKIKSEKEASKNFGEQPVMTKVSLDIDPVENWDNDDADVGEFEDW